MPIYEYVCNSCGHELEKLQKLSDGPLTDCPECGKPSLARKLSAPGFRLKGGGWYETDFKSSGKKNVAGDPGESKTAKPDKTDKPVESKPAESKPTKPSGGTEGQAA
jgi:putative FmdB family regulatory protein